MIFKKKKFENYPPWLCNRRPSWIFGEKSENFKSLLLFYFSTNFSETLQICTVMTAYQNVVFSFSIYLLVFFFHKFSKIPQKKSLKSPFFCHKIYFFSISKPFIKILKTTFSTAASRLILCQVWSMYYENCRKSSKLNV